MRKKRKNEKITPRDVIVGREGFIENSNEKSANFGESIESNKDEEAEKKPGKV